MSSSRAVPAARQAGNVRRSSHPTPSSAAKNKTPSSASGSDSQSRTLTKPKPSQKLNPKTIDPFNEREQKNSTFASIYSNGGVPCRLVHGSVKHKLQWNSFIEQIPFDPVLITLAEGLRESKHPYTFVARTGFREMLEQYDAKDKAVAVLPRIVTPLRVALGSKDNAIFEAALEAMCQLSGVVGAHLNPHLKVFLQPLSRRFMEKNHSDRVTEALQLLEQNGGKESLSIIKSKVPTYSSIFT